MTGVLLLAAVGRESAAHQASVNGESKLLPPYIRAFVLGGTFFFTVALLERHRKLLNEHIDHLRAAFWAAPQNIVYRTGLHPFPPRLFSGTL